MSSRARPRAPPPGSSTTPSFRYGCNRRNREPFLGAFDTAKNMPDHAEHHAYPTPPFHALPAAHRALAAPIAVQAPGYIAAHREIVGAFRRSHRGSAS